MIHPALLHLPVDVLTQRREDAHRLIPLGEDVRALNAERFNMERALHKLQVPQAMAAIHVRGRPSRRCRQAKPRQAHEGSCYTQRGQAFQAIAQTHTAMMAWLQHGKPPGTVCEDFDGEPKLNKGEDILAAIEKLRRRGRELKADLARISAAPFPSSHAKAKMRQEIEALAQRGIPSMALLVEHDREVQWPTTNLRSAIFDAQTPSFAAVETTDTLALFAWLHRDALIARLDALISDEADDAASLWHEARERQAAEVPVIYSTLSAKKRR